MIPPRIGSGSQVTHFASDCEPLRRGFTLHGQSAGADQVRELGPLIEVQDRVDLLEETQYGVP